MDTPVKSRLKTSKYCGSESNNPWQTEERIDLRFRKILCEKEKEAKRQESGDRRGHDACPKKKSHLPELKEAEGKGER